MKEGRGKEYSRWSCPASSFILHPSSFSFGAFAAVRRRVESAAMTDPSSSLNTQQLASLLLRLRQGDAGAADELVRRTALRLERLVRQMLHHYPVVRSQEQTADVLQESTLRLLAALREVTPDSTRAFYALASQHIRFHLLDLARRFRRGAPRSLGDCPDPVAPGSHPAEADDLERWQALHEAVEQLPADLREVFELRFYQGWSWPQIAALLGVNERTARRGWLRAGILLGEKLGGRAPSQGPD
jgi:RNA polymerase sigma-70 factor (ECF subfamily)